MRKYNQYVAKIATIQRDKLKALDILYTTYMIGGIEHIMMTERDWKWAIRARAAVIHPPCKPTIPNSLNCCGK